MKTSASCRSTATTPTQIAERGDLGLPLCLGARAAQLSTNSRQPAHADRKRGRDAPSTQEARPSRRIGPVAAAGFRARKNAHDPASLFELPRASPTSCRRAGRAVVAACGQSGPASIAGGECKIFEPPQYEVRGARAYDQDWIDSQIEGGVGGCHWRGPAPRPATLDGAPALKAAATQAVPKASSGEFASALRRRTWSRPRCAVTRRSSRRPRRRPLPCLQLRRRRGAIIVALSAVMAALSELRRGISAAVGCSRWR